MPEHYEQGPPLGLQGEWAQRAFVELNESPEAAVEALHELKLKITGTCWDLSVEFKEYIQLK